MHDSPVPYANAEAIGPRSRRWSPPPRRRFELFKEGVAIGLVHVHAPDSDMAERAGLLTLVGEDHLFADVSNAVSWGTSQAREIRRREITYRGPAQDWVSSFLPYPQEPSIHCRVWPTTASSANQKDRSETTGSNTRSG
jgi:hypothetical protein